MLTDGDRASMQAAWETALDTLGVPATWKQTKDPQATKDVVIGFKTVGLRDSDLINAYGVGAKIFTIKVSDIEVVEKFDRVTVQDEVYTIESSMPVHLNGVQVFWKAVSTGK